MFKKTSKTNRKLINSKSNQILVISIRLFIQFLNAFYEVIANSLNFIRKLIDQIFAAIIWKSSKDRLRKSQGKYPDRSKNSKLNHISLTAFCLTIVLIISQLIFLNPAYATPDVCGTPGNESPTVISNTVNTYYPGTAATVSTGANSIEVGEARGAFTPITAGDLLLVIQMQDAAINVPSDPNSNNYGGNNGTGTGFTDLRTAGAYQYVVATNDVPLTGGPVNLSQPLAFTFTNADATTTDGQRRYQIIRVPQYASATINSTVTAYAWDGRVGGVVALDVAGDLTFSSGIIDVSGEGFRGGGGTNLGGDNTSGAPSQNSVYYHPAPPVTGIGVSSAPRGANHYDGSKGEGIAGTPRYTRNGGFPPVTGVTDNLVDGYPLGSFSRGAPANAGGGGTDPNRLQNSANTGGGGGANAGAGGKGGDSWTDNSFPTTPPPGRRLPFGGLGGTAISPSVSRIFLGGGGGAGTSNNSTTGNVPSGGGGGGMVIVRSGRILGSGTINANGIQGVSPSSTDGGGGGGAGGTVLIQSVTPSTPSISINARGGDGLNSGFREHGPGGGGGGGYIAYQGFTPVTNVSPGAAGFMLTDDRNSAPSTNNYGAISGSIGLVESTTIPAAEVKAGAACLPSLSVTKTTDTPTITKPASGAIPDAIYTITVTNNADSVNVPAENVVISDQLPLNFSYASTTSITLSGTATRITTNDPTPGATNPAWGVFRIPSGGQVQIVFRATISNLATLGTYQNPALATYDDPQRTTDGGRTTASYDSASSTNEDVTIIDASPKLLLAKRITAVNDTDITSYVADSDPDWATYIGANTNYLRGAVDNVSVKPGDRLEYTLYFLVSGNRELTNVTICDLIPTNTTFVNGAYDVVGGGNNLGIAFANDASTLPTVPTNYFTSIFDSDRGQFYPVGSLPPSTCKQPTTNATLTADDNTNGLVVVNVVTNPTTLPHATGEGTPTNSYGFVRFQVRVK